MIVPARLPPLREGDGQAKQGLGQKQLGLTMKNQQKNPVDRALQQDHGNTPTTLQPTHDLTKNAKIRPQRLARAARNHPLGQGYEQAGAATVEQEMGQTQSHSGGTFSTEHVSPQKLGSAKFKIPTHKRASTQPRDLYAGSKMGGNEVATNIIYIRGRHSPPPRQDLTTHTMVQTLQRQNDPTKPVCTALPAHTASPGSDTPTTQPLDQHKDVLQYFSNEKYQ